MVRDEMVDYRKFRLNKWNTKEFSHLKLLLFWPVFGFLFLFAERIGIRKSYFPVHCTLDDYIPFCEYFLIPYLFWFVYLIGTILYTLLFDVEAFRKMMAFVMITYTVTILIYFIFPTCQELRPATFQRDNVLARFTAAFYQFDTNTNVCPSLHVIGSLAAMFGAWNSKHFHTRCWKMIFGGMAFLISISTVFLKQHSILDVFAAIPICLIGYWMVYKREWSDRND